MNLALLQYLFTKGEHVVKPGPHGNAKGGESYVRTMPSTLMKLKTAAIDKTAKVWLKMKLLWFGLLVAHQTGLSKVQAVNSHTT